MFDTRTLLVVLSIGSMSVAVGCSDAFESGPKETADGVKKDYDDLARKGDQWNDLNDPAKFQTDLVRNWDQLKQRAPSGSTDQEVWPATYWPTYKDGINQRWQGDDTLSPAEKYDLAFNDWRPDGGISQFQTLQPYDHETCEWDQSYYQRLGPAARAAAEEGNWRAHNGTDDDGDGNADAEECGYGDGQNYDGVETWWGLCHAWAPAATLHEEPDRPVTIEGPNGRPIRFDVSDIKALLIDQYDESESYFVGGRCNDREVERQRNGRIPDGKCQDVNAGSFHVLMTNFLGLNGRPIVEDRVYNYEVWNHPVVGYEITSQREIDEQRVRELVNPQATGEGAGQPTTDEETRQVLRAANTLTVSEMTGRAGLRQDRAEMLVDNRERNGEYETLVDIESQVGTRSIARLLQYAYDQNWLEDQPAIFDYDKNADRYVEVEMTVDYLVESSPSAEPLMDRVDEYIEQDEYHYIVEMTEDGTITGGEWVGRSIDTHPDFLWLPTGPGGGNEHIDFEDVETLLAKSTGSSSGGSNAESLRFEQTGGASIPDEDPNGVTSTIRINRRGAVSSLKLDLAIDHPYPGDLVIHLIKGNTKVLVHDGTESGEPWGDGLELTGERIDGFAGADLQGTWTLQVVDVSSPDAGQLSHWALEPSLQ